MSIPALVAIYADIAHSNRAKPSFRCFFWLFMRFPIGGVQYMPYISLADGVGMTNNQPFTESGNHGKDR